MSRKAERATSRFRGIELNISKVSAKPAFEEDQNGRHRVKGEWQIRKGFARAPSIVVAGQVVERLFEFVAQGNNRMIIAFRGNGDLIAAPTPTESWT